MKSQFNINQKYSNTKLKIAAIISCLIPFSLALGPFLPEIFFIISFLILSKEIFFKKNKYFNNNLFKVFLLFYFYILFNSIIQNYSWGEDFIFSRLYCGDFLNCFKIYFFDQKSIIFFFRYYFYMVVLWYLFDNYKKFTNYFYFSLIISITFIGVDALIQYITGTNLIGIERTNLHRLSGIFNDEFILGSYYLRMYFIFFGLFIFLNNFKEKKTTYYFILINLFFSILIFLSGERSALFLFILSLFLSFIFLKKIKYKFFLNSILILFVSVTFISFFDGNIRDRIFNQTIDEFSDKTNGKIYIFTEVHHGHYMSAKLMFRENFFFGVGPNQFEKKCQETKYHHFRQRCATHPHNYYVQLFSETGIFGGLFLVFTIFYILYRLLKSLVHQETKLNDNDILNFFLLGFLVFLWPAVPHANVFNNWIIMSSLISLSFFKHYSYKINN